MDKIEKELMRLGCCPSKRGFEPLAKAVQLWKSGERTMTGPNGIYAKATAPGATVSRTERNI